MLARHLTENATVWDVTLDEYGGKNYSQPRVVSAIWKTADNVALDDNGIEFMPKDSFYLLEGIPRGSYIAKGDQSFYLDPLSADSAFPVRQVKSYPPQIRRTQTYYEVLTG